MEQEHAISNRLQRNRRFRRQCCEVRICIINVHEHSVVLTPFSNVCRALRRLYELLDSLDLAAQVVGDTELSERFKKSKQSIRKGLPFAASLYI